MIERLVVGWYSAGTVAVVDCSGLLGALSVDAAVGHGAD